jgi:putative membrane protein
MVEKQLISLQDQTLISAAVKKIEEQTSGEIVTVITKQSDRYFADALAIGVILSFLYVFFLHALHPEYGFKIAEVSQLIVMIACTAFLEFTGLIARFVPTRFLREAVQKNAREQFFNNGLHTTKNHASVLILISLRERHVEIIADRGIHAKVEGDPWKIIANELGQGLKTKNYGEAISKAIMACGTLLQSHFPLMEDPANELPNDIIILP